MEKKYYLFTIVVGGYGDTAEEAWDDFMENVNPEEFEQPSTYKIDEEITDGH